ncbi:MAG: hypothetical protein ACXVHX_34020 [Solirubrobacteraceae bacterium]
MANKVRVELDERLMRRARTRASDPDASDSEVIAAVVAEALGFAALRDAQEVGRVSWDEADTLAVKEVRAQRSGSSDA